MAISDFLTMDIEVWRRQTGATNDYGESADIWVKKTTLKGLIQPKVEDVAREESGILKTADAVLYTLVTANIKQSDKVKDPDGNEYNVLAVMDEAGQTHHFKCILKRNS